MERELHEINVAQVEPSSFRNTFKLLPVGRKGKQKFVCGDDSGAISCYEMKRGEPQLVFKSPGVGGPVRVVAMGGLSSAGGGKDRIFYAQGQRVTGINKKGKEFFRLTSSLTEDIHHMAVEETCIWTGCEYVYNLYDDGKDVGFYMCNDRIHALTVNTITCDGKFDAVLGCQDKVVRVIQGSNCLLQMTVDGPVNALTFYQPVRGGTPPTKAGPRDLVYGTENGLVGWARLVPESGGGGLRGVKTWVLQNTRKQGAVNCLDVFDVSRDGVRDIVVGRDDGQVQVYSIQDTGEPELQFERNVGESIRSLECGIVNTVDYQEIIMSCISGRVVSFTSEPLKDRASDDQYGRSLGMVQNENKIKNIKKEIETLRQKVDQERERYARHTQESVPMSQPFQIITKFTLDPEEAAYKLTLEIPSPIDVVCLKSTVRLDLLDSLVGGEEGGTPAPGSTAAIATVMTPAITQLSGAALMATFRPPDDSMKRIVIKARTTEGEYGDIILTAVAKMSPKSAQTVRYRVKPLSLHQRVNELTPEQEARPKNTLRLTGSFSVSLMHEWISLCLPEVPPRLASAADDSNNPITLYFRNVFTNSVFTCEYAKGTAQVTSDSISSVAIFKEVVSREANSRRVQISDSFRMREETVPVFLRLMHPRLERQALIARQVDLIDAIKELQMQEPNSHEWLSPEYQQILRDADYLRSEVKKRPRALEYLAGIITDLYVDVNKFRGQDVRHQIPHLQRLVMDYQPDSLLAFMSPLPETASLK